MHRMNKNPTKHLFFITSVIAYWDMSQTLWINSMCLGYGINIIIKFKLW